MTLKEKIELFNKLKNELQKEYGCFDDIKIVNEIPHDAVEDDGQYYFDSEGNGCCYQLPVMLYVKMSDVDG